MKRTFAVLALLWLAATPAHAQGKKYALLVGVSKYDSTPLDTLTFPANDAEKMGELLVKKGFDKVVVMTHNATDAKLKPTAKNILEQIEAILGACNHRTDVVWIGLAGHGLQANVSPPPKVKGEAKVFTLFCPSDANLTDADKIEYATGKSKTLVNLQTDLFARMAKCGAGLKVLLVDACRDDREVNGRGLDAGVMQLPLNTLALFACASGQKAREFKSLQHGVFFHFAIKALEKEAANSEGKITWGGFASYVGENVSKYVQENVTGGAEQTPYAYSNGAASPVLLVLNKKPDLKEAEEQARLYREGLARLYGQGELVDEAAAYKLFEKAAAKGHVKAKAVMGYMHHCGMGMPVDKKKAQELAAGAVEKLREVAKTDADAANWLGLLTYTGLGVKYDPDEAAKLFLAAAEKGDPDAMDNLGNYYYWVMRDYEKAVAWYRKAAARNLPSGQVHMGNMYLKGTGVELSEKRAFDYYKQTADRAYPPGMQLLGRAYQYGWHAQVNPKEVRKWLRKAIERGDTEAMRELAQQLLADGNAPRADRDEAMELFQRAIDRFNANAMVSLAKVYATGLHGIPTNEEKAKKLFGTVFPVCAAEGMFQAGKELYAAGASERDKGKAKKFFERSVEWQQRAAKAGSVPAMTQLGILSMRGEGTDKDGEKAAAWLTKAADKGDVIAMRSLGILYDAEDAVKPRDERKAVEWYRKAAAKGDKPSKGRLAVLRPKG